MINLRVYELAVQLYRETKAVRFPAEIGDQFKRAMISVSLNLAEGYGKATTKDRRKFFVIALGSIREVQAVADLEPELLEKYRGKIEQCAAGIYKLTR